MILNLTLLLAENNSHALSNVYQYADTGIALLHRQSLKSVGIMSIVASHLAAHLATGKTFDDADTVFKRAYYRAIALISQNQPQLSDSLIDFSDANKKIRIGKFKKQLKKEKLASRHHFEQQKTMNQVNENLMKMSSSDQKQLETSAAQYNGKTVAVANNNELLNGLYAQLLVALGSNDEQNITLLQKQIASIEPNI